MRNAMPRWVLCRSRQCMFAAIWAVVLCVVFVPANVHAQGAESWEALRDRAASYYEEGDLERAIATQERVVEIAKAQFSPDDPRLVLSLLNQGALLYNFGRYSGAISSLNEVLRLQGLSRKYRAKAYMALGRIEIDQGGLANAESYLDKARKLLSPNDDDSPRLTILSGDLRTKQGRHDDAVALYKDAIRILENDPRGRYEKLVIGYNNLALAYENSNRFSLAEEFYKKADTVAKKYLTPGSSIVLVNLGSLYRAMGRYDEARRYLVEAQVLAEQRFGPESIHVASALDHLCLLQRDEEDYDLAVRTCERALAIRKKVNGEDSAAYLNTLGNAADVWVKQGKMIQAGRAYEEVLKRAQAQYGEDSPKLVRAYNDMGAYLHQNGHLKEAETYLQKALTLLKQSSGAEPLREAAIRGNLANVYRDRKQYKAALREYQSALSLQRKLLGDNHVTVVHTLVDMGVLYHRQGKRREAQRYYQQALRAAEAGLWPEHPQVLLTRQYLAALKAGKGVPGD